MIVAVASGKGGTGKTSVAVNLGLSIREVQLLDCDVEEPNAHILLHPKISRSKPVYTLVPNINEELCNHCGDCSKFCQYNALFTSPNKMLVFPELCHNCGGCTLVCSKKAIVEKKHRIGKLKFGAVGDLDLVYGELEVGKPTAVPVIKAVKKHISRRKNVILDSPPGASCPLIETVRDSDFCILVAEPTPFGLYDLKLTVQVLLNIKIPFGVIINRANTGYKKVREYCKANSIPILLEIPYKKEIAELYSRGIPFSLKMTEWKGKFQTLHDEIKGIV